jgi:hypothetical protein
MMHNRESLRRTSERNIERAQSMFLRSNNCGRLNNHHTVKF